LAVLQPFFVTQAQAAVTWTPISATTVIPIWHQTDPETGGPAQWSRKDLYIAIDTSSVPAYAAGTTQDTGHNNEGLMVDRAVFDSDGKIIDREPFLSVKNRRSPATAISGLNFDTMGVGPVIGDPAYPDKPLAAYWWVYSGADLDPWGACTGTTITRLVNGSDHFEWACINISSYMQGDPTGGEVDQLTGRIYFQGATNGSSDSTSRTSTARSTSSWSYAIWDPTTGTVVGNDAAVDIQPGGMTSYSSSAYSSVPVERQNAFMSLACINANTPPASCTTLIDSPSLASDMALDAAGNIYQYAQSESKHGLIYRVVPSRDSNGNIIQGTVSNPWKYYVVSHITNPSDAASAVTWGGGDAAGLVGSAFYNGHMYVGGYNNMNPGTGACGVHKSVLDVDPLSTTAFPYCTASDFLSTSTVDSKVPGATGTASDDFASAQTAAVIQGYVYHDIDGDGVIDENGDGGWSNGGSGDDPGLAEQKVALYRDDTDDGIDNPKLVALQNTDSTGHYSFLVYAGEEGAETTYRVRVMQPHINVGTAAAPVNVNMVQTWANGGRYIDINQNGKTDPGEVYDDDAATGSYLNETITHCWYSGDDPAEIRNTQAGGKCSGAVNPYDFPDTRAAQLNDTLTPQQAANQAIYSTVHVLTSRDVADADFAVTAAFSDWGDAQGTNVKVTPAEKGPYHQNLPGAWVKLGSELGKTNLFNADGSYNSSAVAHHATSSEASSNKDDGVKLQVKVGEDLWVDPQGQVLAYGGSYVFKADVEISPVIPEAPLYVDAVEVKGWISGAYSSGSIPSALQTSAAQMPLNGNLSSAGQVLTGTVTGSTWTAPSGSAFGPAVLRVNASVNDNVSDPDNTNWRYAAEYSDVTGGAATGNTLPWVSSGEIEDYGMFYASGVVRVGLKTIGGTRSETFTVATDPASALVTTNGFTASDTVTTDTAGTPVLSTQSHPLASTTAKVTITPAAVSAPWKIVADNTKCYETATGVDFSGYTVATSGVVTLTSGVGAVKDVTCVVAIEKAPDPAKSEFTLDTDTKTVGENITGTVTVKDSDGVPLPGQTVTFSSDSSDVTLSATTCTTGDGTSGTTLGQCSITLTSNKAATYTNAIHAKVKDPNNASSTTDVLGGGDDAKKSPKTVTFTPAPAGAASSLFEISPSDASQKVNTNYTITVTALDALGNLVPGTSVAFSSTETSVSFSATTCTTGTNGQCTATFTSTKAGGPYQVSGKIGGSDIGGGGDSSKASPQTKSFTADEIADTCEAGVTTCSSLEVLDPSKTVGENARVRITLTDKWGNPISGKTQSELAITATGLTVGTFTESGSTGVYNGTVTTTTVGDYTVSAKPSPLSTALSDGVSFTVDTASAQYSLFQVDAGPKTVGTDYTVTVTAYDAYGNTVPGTEVVFSSSPTTGAQFAGTAATTDDKCTTGTSGTCTITFTSTKDGTYSISGKIGGSDIGGNGDSTKASPQSRVFTVGPVDLTASTLAIAPASVPVGTDAVATATLKDQYGNAITGKSQADLGLSAQTGLTLKSDFAEGTGANAGVYTVTVTATVPDSYTLTSTTTGDTATVTFTASQYGSAANSTLTVTPSASSQQVGQLYTLQAAVYDGIGTANGGKGNPVSGATVTFGASPTGGTFTPSAGTCDTGSNGICSVTFTSTTPGTYSLSATIKDRDTTGNPDTALQGSPVSKTFTVGDIDASNSSLAVDDNAIAGDNASVIVTLQDSYGNPVTGLTKAQLVLGSSPTDSDSSFGTFTETSPGVYTGTFTSTQATTYTITSKPSPLTTAMSDSVTFSTTTANANNSELVVTPAGTLTVGDAAANTYTMTVTVKDNFNSVVSGVGVNFSVTAAAGSAVSPTLGPILSATSCTTDVSGQCYVTVYSKKAGTFDLHAKIGATDFGGGGDPVKESPAQRTWTAATTPDPAHSSLTVSPSSVTAGGTTTATIVLGDAYGNPISGYSQADMVLSVSPSGPGFTGFAETSTPDTYTVTVNSLTAAGTKTIKAQPSPFTAAEALSGTVTVTAKQTDWVATWAPDSGNPATGEYKRVTLTVKDEYGNPISGLLLGDFSSPNSWDSMTVKATSPDLTSGQANGEYYWELAGSTAKDYSPQISITSASPSAITKSTTIKVVNSAVGSVEVAVAYPSGRSDAVVSGPSSAGTDPYGVTVTVTVRDSANAPMLGLSVGDFTFTGSAAPYGPTSWKVPSDRALDPTKDWLVKAGSFTDNLDGTYTFKVASTRAGTYNAAVTVSGVTSPAEDAKFVPAAPSDPGGVTLVICPSNTVCTDDPGTNAGAIEVFQDQAYAFLEVTDDYGNFVELDDLTTTGVNEANTVINAGLASSPTGAVLSTGATWTAPHDAYGNRTGPYRTTLTGPTGTTYTVSVTISGVMGSDKVKFKPSSLDHVTLSLSDSTHVVCKNLSGNCVTATIQAFDAANNPIPGLTAADITWVSNPAGVAVNTVDAQWAESPTGTYTAKIYATQAANYSVKATVQGVDSNQVPISFTAGTACEPGVDADCPDPDVNPDNAHRTRLEITTDNANADGTSKNRITVFLFDAFGNPVPGQQVRSCEGGCTGVTVATSPIANTDAAGQTIVEYTATTGDSKSVTVQYSADGSTWKHVKFVAQGGSTPPANYASSPATIHFKWRSLPTTGSSTLTVAPDPVTVGGNLTATLVVKDGANQPVTGLANVLTLTSPGMTDIGNATESPDGTYTWSAKASTTAAASYTATVEDEASGTATDTFAVVAGAPSAANSTLSAAPASQQVGGNIVVTYTVKDSYNNPVTGLTSTDFSTTGAYQSGGADGTPNISATSGSFVDSGGGVYTWNITSKKKGEFELTGQVKSVTLSQHPVITFTSAGVCVTGCEGDGDPNHVTHATVTKNDQKANGTDTDEVTVYAYDTYGNVVSGAAIVANRDGNTALTPDPVSGTTGADGTYVVKWTSTQAGTFKATITVDGLGGFDGAAPANIHFNPLDDPSATTSTLTISPTTAIAAGQSFTLTATVRDENNNLLDGQSVSFTASDPAVTFDYDNCSTDSGVCQVTATSTTAGTYTIDGKINVTGTPTHIAGDGSDAQKSPKTVTWNADSACVPPGDTGCSSDPDKQTRVTVTANGQTANDTAKDVATLYVFDKYGNPVSGAAWSTSTTDSDLHIVTASGTTGTDGTATLEYTSGQVGTYSAAVTAAGKAVAQSPISLSFQAGDAAAVTAAASPAGPVTAGGSYTLTITAVDASSHPVAGVAATFTLPTDLTGGTSCSTGSDGTCSVTVTSTKAGTYSVDVATTPAATPATLSLVFEAGTANAANTATEVIKDNVRPDSTETNVIKVTVRDQYGNPVPNATVTSTSSDSHMSVGTAAPTDADGVTQITYTADAEGDYDASITAGGVTPAGGAGSPVELHFRYAQVDPANSSWTVTPASPLDVGTGAPNTYTATVTAQDSEGHPVGNAGVTFALDQTGPTWVSGASCTTNASGQCSVEVYSTKSGTYSLSASASAGPIGSSISIAWNAEAVCDKDCTPEPGVDNITEYEVTTDNQVADNTAADVITVRAYDKYGNPVPNVPVGASSTDGDLRIASTINPTNAAGETVINLYSKVAGQHSVDSIWIGPDSDKKYPANLPATVNFTTGPGCASADPNCPDPGTPDDKRTRLEVTTNNAVADGTATDVITVYVFDKMGNPVATEIQSTATSSDVTVGTIADTSATTGATTIDYTTTKAGDYTVHVQFKREGAWEDVTFKPQDGTAAPANTSSPATLTFVAGAPSAANSALSASPTTQTVGSNIQVTATVKDANNNPVTNLVESDFAITGEYTGTDAGTPDIAATAGTFVNDGGGVYTFNITSEKVGDFDLTGIVKSVTLDQHPTISFTAGGVCVSGCSGDAAHTTHAEITKNNQKANGTDTDEVTVYAFDTYGNPVPGASVVAERNGNTALTPDPVTGTTSADGTYVVKWTSTQAGTFSATIKIDGSGGFDGWAPSTLKFNPLDDPSAAESTLAVSPATAITAGESFTLTATVKDENGNVLEGQSVSFSASDAAVSVDATCTTANDGTCTATATSNTAGSYTVSAYVNVAGTQTEIAGDGSDAQKSPKTLVWNAGPACVPPGDSGCSSDPDKQSRVAVVDNDAVADGVAKDTAKVYLFDRLGNPIAGGAWSVSTTDSDLSIVSASGTTGTDGTSTLEFTSESVGAYHAAVTLAGKTPSGSPLELRFQSGAAADITASKSPAGPVTVSGSYTVGIHAADSTGNPVASVGATFTLPSDVTTSGSASCSTDAFGNCSIQVTSTKSGTFSIGVTTSPAADPATLQVEFTAGAADASKTKTEWVKNGALPNGTDQDVVRVIARDSYDNPVPNAQVTSASSATEVTVGTIANTDANGITQITYTATAEGSYPADITVGGITPAGGLGSPVTLDFAENQLDPSKSSWTVTPAGPLMVGEDAAATYTATVTAHGSDDLPAANAVVTFTVDAGPVWGTTNTCKTDADGTCSVTLYSTVAGTFALSASAAAGPIGAAQSVTWSPEAVCDKDCVPEPDVDDAHKTRYEVTIDNQVADNTAADVITVYAFDKYGNPVPHQPVGAAGADVRIQSGIAATDASGATTVSVYSKVAGSHDVEVWIGPDSDKKLPPDLPATLHFIPGPGCSSADPNCPDPSVPDDKRTRLEVTTDNALANGTAADVITVYVFDKMGNPVVTEIQSDAGADVTVGTIANTTAATGSTTIEYTSSKADSYQATVQFKREGVWEDVVFKPQDGSAAPANTSSPATIKFGKGAPSPANSNMTASPATQTVGDTVKVTLTIKDANNNVIADLVETDFLITGAASGADDIAATAGTFVNEGGGVYTFDITSKAVGAFELTGVVQGVTLNQHPSVTFTAGGVCVSNCEGDAAHTTRAEITKNDQKANGTDTDEVTVYAFDTYGNAVSGASVVAERNGNTALTPDPVTGTTDASGKYVVKWTSTQAGTFSATITVDGSGGFEGWAPSTLHFNPLDDPSETKSTLTVSPAGPLTAGQAYTLTATVKDANGNVLKDQSVAFSADSAVTIDASCTTGNDGTCIATAISDKAGSYTARAFVNIDGIQTEIAGDGSDAQKSPKTLVWNAGPACVPPGDSGCSSDPDKQSRIAVVDNDAVADGAAKDTAKVYLYDRLGNPISGGAWAVSTTDSDLSIVTASGTTGADGTATVEFTSTVVGTYHAAATLAGKTAQGSPVELRFQSGAAAAITASKSPAGPIAVGGEYTIGIHAVDSTGNAVANVGATFTLPSDVTTSGSNGCLTDAFGNCTIKVTSTKAGTYTIAVQSAPAASPASLDVEFSAGAVDGSKSEVLIVKNGALPNGVDQDVVRVIARDSYGNPVPGVTVASTATGMTVGAIAPTGSDGVTQITYTATVAGTYPADITVAGQTPQLGVGSPVNLGFSDNPIDPSKSSWTVSPASPIKVGEDADSTYTATVTARGSDDLPAANAVVTFSVAPAGPVWGSGYSCTTDASGQCSVTLYSTKAGTYSLSAAAAVGPIGSAKPVTWSAEAVCDKDCVPEPGVDDAHKTRYEVTVDNQTADDASPDKITVYAFDKYGNAVPNQPVGAASTSSGVRIQSGIPSTNEAGSAVVNVYSTTAGTAEVDLWIGPESAKKLPPDLPAELHFKAGGGCAGSDPSCPDPSVPDDRRTRLEVTADNATANGTAVDKITVYVFDKYGNPVSTAVQSNAGSDVAVAAIANTSASTGATVVDYTSTKAGSYQATVQFQREGVWEDVVFKPQDGSAAPANTSSPATIKFGNGDPSAANSSLAAAPATQTVGQVVKATLTIKDANNNAIANLAAADFTLAGAYVSGGEAGTPDIAALSGTFVNEGGGVYTFDITSTKVGRFSLTATVKGITLNQHPNVTFTSGGVCVSNCLGDPEHTTRAEVTKNNQKANGSDTDEVTVYAFDSYGNPVSGAAVVGTRDNNTALTPATVSGSTNASGAYVVKWTSTVAGTFAATITVDGQNGFEGWAPSNLKFNPLDDPDAGQSSVTVSPAGPLQAGQPYTLTVTVKDANGNLMEDQGVTFAADSPVNVAGACTTDASGTCSVTAVSNAAGSFDVSVYVNVDSINTEVTGSPATLVWQAGAVCVPPVDSGCSSDPDKQSRIDVVKGVATADGTDKAVAKAYLFDKLGNPVPGGAWSITTSDSALHIVTASGTTGADGTATVEFTSTVAGTYHAAAKLAGKTPQGSPVELRFQSGAAAAITASKSPAGPVEVGDTYTLGIHAVDATGNPVAGVAAVFVLPPDVTANGSKSCATDAFGNCSIQVTSTKSGSFNVAVQSSPEPTPASLSLQFTSGAVDGSKSEVQLVKNGALPNGADQDVLRVIARDSYGNPVANAQVASTAAAPVTVGPIANTGADGVTQITYTATAEGTYPAEITVAGTTPQLGLGSPAQLSFAENKLDPSKSSWTVSPASPIPVGSAYTLTVTARGSDNNPAANAIVTFTVSGSGPTWGNGYSCKTDASGNCSVTISSTVSGTFELAAQAAAGPIGQAKSVAWSAEAVCDKDCVPEPGVDDAHKTRYEVTVNGQVADNASADVIKVYAFDRYGNPVPNQPVGAAGADVRVQTAIPATNAQGVSTVNVYSKVAGEHEVEVWIGPASAKKLPPDLPALLTFVPGGGCSGSDSSCPDPSVPNDKRTRLEVTANNAVAGSGVADVVTVYVFDKYGNPVATAIQSTAPAGVTVGSPIADTAADTGSTAISYTSNADGDFQVAVQFQLNGVWETVVFKPQPGTTAPTAYKSSPATITFTDGDAPDAPSSAHQDRDTDGKPVVTNQPANDAEPGSTIVVTWPDGSTTETTVGPDGSWSVEIPTGMADGDAKVVAKDAAGNTSAEVTVPIDVTKPNAPSSAHQEQTENGPVVTNKPATDAQAGDTVTVTWPDGSTSTTTVGPDGTWSVQIPAGMADGEATVTVTDPAGNTSNPVKVPIDVTAPAAPTIDKANASEISGTGDPGSKVTVTFPAGSSPATAEATVGPDGKWKIETPSTVESGTITVVATDSAGNPSNPVTKWLDADVPPPPAIDKAYNSLIEGHIDPARNDPGTIIRVTLPDGSTVDVTPDADGKWNVAIPPGADVAGPISAVAIDPAGNVSDPATGVREYPGPVEEPHNPEAHQDGDKVVGCNATPGNEIITTFPDGTVETVTVGADGCWSVDIPDGMESGDTTVVQRDPESGKQSDPTHVTIDTDPPADPNSAHQDRVNGQPVVKNDNNDAEPGATIVVTWPDGSTSTTTVNPDGSWSVPIPEGVDGTAKVVIKDAQGNTSGEVSVPVDAKPPHAPDSAHQDGNKVTNAPAKDAEPGSTITVTWPDGTTSTTVVGPDGSWSVDIPPGTPSGTVTVTATDPDGNTSAPTQVQLDTDAPDQPSSAHQDRENGKPVVTNKPANDAHPGDIIEITWPDGTKDTVTVGPDGSWSVEIPEGMADGNASVVAKDANGNTSAAVTVPVDVTPPASPADAHQVGNQVTNSPSNSGTPGDTIIVTWPDGTTVTTVVGPDGSWSVTIPSGVTGEATVVARDAAGNTSVPVKVQLHEPMSAMVDEIYVETAKNTPVAIPVLANVRGGEAPITLASYTDPGHGTITSSTAAPAGFGVLPTGTRSLTYRPAKNYVGDDYFTVTVQDAAGDTVDVPVHVLTLEPEADDETPDSNTGGELAPLGTALAGQLALAGMALVLLAAATRRRRAKG
jgi:predicted RNA-binding protein with TRAM domain